MMDYVKEQKELMESIYKETFKNKDAIVEIFKGDTDPNVNVSLYGESLIKESHKILIEKMENFNKDLYKIQKHKFRFQVASLILFLIISLVGIAGYWVRREYIPWIASLLLLILAAPVFGMAGLETTYTFLSIDFCSSIGNSIISGIIPSENKGIGTYLSCPSKETMRTISTAIYQYVVTYDYLFNKTDYYAKERTWLRIEEGLGEDKRNNTYFKQLYDIVSGIDKIDIDENDKKGDEDQILELVKRNLKSFGVMNVLMAGLLSMTSCYTAKNSINYIEEKYCYKNHAYMFRNVIFDTIAAIGFIVISVGLNKLIITMRSHFAKSLRGKKEFNTDIIDDDDD
jgi:hypothetical protein